MFGHEPPSDRIFHDRTRAQLFFLSTRDSFSQRITQKNENPYTNISFAQDKTYHKFLKSG